MIIWIYVVVAVTTQISERHGKAMSYKTSTLNLRDSSPQVQLLKGHFGVDKCGSKWKIYKSGSKREIQTTDQG